ncbi:hypothetical protein FB451DRAFT_1397418 [Mycena latifolia]|nr:hypothetical protein FB451DRAFT_1397418 [Mycena latifolia]
MRFISTLFLLSSASALGALGAAVRGTTNTTISARVDGGFAGSCGLFNFDLWRDGDPALTANCESQTNQFTLSTLFLNECVANNNGVLACRAGGAYGKSCFTFGFSSGTVLHATCKNNAGAAIDTTLELTASVIMMIRRQFHFVAVC